MFIIDDLKHKMILHYRSTSFKNIPKLLTTDGVSVIALYRINQFFIKIHIGIIAMFFRRVNRLINACWIGRNAKFGRGFVIMHPYGVVINSNVIGGDNIVLQSGVIIGAASDKNNTGFPKIGNNVVIGAGAKILGDITIGNNVTIGANAVIIRDVPDNSTVVGVPGKVIRILDNRN